MCMTHYSLLYMKYVESDVMWYNCIDHLITKAELQHSRPNLESHLAGCLYALVTILHHQHTRVLHEPIRGGQAGFQ